MASQPPPPPPRPASSHGTGGLNAPLSRSQGTAGSEKRLAKGQILFQFFLVNFIFFTKKQSAFALFRRDASLASRVQFERLIKIAFVVFDAIQILGRYAK